MDRKGRVLLTNEYQFNLYIKPAVFTVKAFSFLAKTVSLTVEQKRRIQALMKKTDEGSSHGFVRAVGGLSRAHRQRLSLAGARFTGTQFRSEWIRRYPYGNLACHALGYVNMVTREELRLRPVYGKQDKIGRRGIERMYESYLRPGSPDRTGVACRPGHNLFLTLDLDLQQAVEKSMKPHLMGAVVAVEADTGRIRAILSKPSIDLTLLAVGITKEEARKIFQDPRLPLLDRSVAAAYNPGGTLKIMSVIAALELPRSPAALFSRPSICLGSYFGPVSMRPALKGVRSRSRRSFHDLALAFGCNAYFVKLASEVGFHRLAGTARALGLGRSPGLWPSGERSGFFPGVARKGAADRAVKSPEGQDLGRTASGHLPASLGQGPVLVTPLQLALVYAAVANGGKLYRPTLVERIETADGKIVFSHKAKISAKTGISAPTLRSIQNALRLAVVHPRGGARRAQVAGMAISGMSGTGSLPVSALFRGRKGSKSRPGHAWFAGYAPCGKSKLVLVVLLEHGGDGSVEAAEVAKRIFEALKESGTAGRSKHVSMLTR